jgi:hypothetical protein
LRRDLDLRCLRSRDVRSDERGRHGKNGSECNPLEHGVPLWFRGCYSETDAPHPGVTVGLRGSNQRTMGETPDFNGLRPLISGFPVSVTKPFCKATYAQPFVKKP